MAKKDVPQMREVLTVAQSAVALNTKLLEIVEDQEKKLVEAKAIIEELTLVLDDFSRLQDLEPLSRKAAIWLADRNRQKRAARKPRSDALQHLIENILKDRPELTAPQVIGELKKKIGAGVVETITSSEIEWTDNGGAAESTPITAIKDRVHRAKRKKLFALTG